MFDIEKKKTLHVTKGDSVYFGCCGKDKYTNEPLIFMPGDIVRMKVYGKNNVENVVLQKDFLVESPTQEVYIYLDSDDTNIGGNINRRKEYSYEVSVNPDTKDETTIIGHFKEGAVSFFLYPEGAEIPKTEPDPEEIPVVDMELDGLSERPVANKAVTAAILTLMNEISSLKMRVETLTAGEGEQE